MEVFNMKSIMFAIALSSLLSLNNVEVTARYMPLRKASAPAQAKKPDGSIQSFCSDTDYPSECFNSITPFLFGKLVDGNSVLRAGIQSLTDRTDNAIHEFAKRRGEAIAKSSQFAERVDVCLAYYGVATASSKNAAEAIASKNYQKLSAELQKAFDVIGDCDDLFAESVEGYEGPFEDINTSLRKVAKNNLALAQHVIMGH